MNTNEAAIRKAYQVAEDKDVVAWVNCFTKDRSFFFDPSKKNSSPFLALSNLLRSIEKRRH